MNQSMTQGRDPAFFAGVWNLLALQVRHYHKHYHMGDNTSVPEETAKELLSSILYTLDKAGGALDLSLGQAVLERQVEEARQLLSLVRASTEICNDSFNESVETIGWWLPRYDHLHFAHRAPEFLSYPLLYRDWEDLNGIDRVLCWLRCLWQECQILAAPVDFEEVYAKFGPDFWSAPINLCQQPLINAIGRCLLGKSPLDLTLEDADRRELESLPDPTPLLAPALERVCREWDIRSPDAKAYAALVLPPLTAQLRAGVSMEQIFV